MQTKFLEGYSIIEMMVTFIIGLIILAAVLHIFFTTKTLYHFHNNFSQMQDNIRFLNAYIPQVVHIAGYRTPPSAGKFTDFTTVFATTPYITGTNGSGTGSDTVTIAFQGSGTGVVADGTIRDCLGRNVGPSVIATNRLYVSNGNLLCDANNPSAVPIARTETLISGVDALQIQYGEDTDSDGIPNRYLNAGTSGLQMSRVVSVRLHFLLKSAEAANTLKDNRQYTLFDLVNYQPGGSTGDYYLRIPVTFTILLRNLIPGNT